MIRAILTRPNLVLATIMMMIAASPIFAVGTVQQTTQAIGRDPGSGPDNRIYQVSINWTADATVGTVPSTAIGLQPAMQGMRLISAEVKPGTPSPSSNYSVTLTDTVGADLLNAAGGSLSATAPASLTISTLGPPLLGGLTFNLSGNSVNSATGTVIAYFAPQSTGVSITPGGPGLGTANTFTGVNTFSQINKTVIVDGTVYPKTDAGINAAIAAAGCGGHVFLPAGTYVLSDITRTQEILIAPGPSCGQGFEMNGEGGETTILQVAAAVPSTEDWIRVAPNAGSPFGFYLHDFMMVPASGNPGRYGINFDETNGLIAHVTVERIRIGTTASTSGNYAIFNTNATPSCNPLFLATFKDNTFWGGVSLINIGDSILFLRNNITGPRDFFIQTVSTGCHSDGGAHGFQAVYNNITTAGATIIKNAWQGYFGFNDVEQTVTSTESNSALLDIQGTSGANNPTENFIVEGNYLGCNSAFGCADSVRVDQAFHTIIKHNYLPRGSGFVIRTTANAVKTEIFENTHAPNGELITTWLADAGTNTVVKWIDETTGVEASTQMAWGTSASTARSFAVIPPQFRAGNAGIFGFTSGADPTATGLDTGFSRFQADGVACGNGVASDNTCTLDLTGIDIEGNARFKETTAPAGFANFDFCYGDSAAHSVKCSYNNGTFLPIPQSVQSGLVFDGVYGTYRVTTDQTITAGASLTNIPGLSWTFPANTALNVKFTCDLLYSQATAAASDSFGFQDVTVAPTNQETYARADTSATAFTAGNTDAAGVTTAVTSVTFTPSAATTIFGAHIDGMIEQPSNASTSAFNIMAQFTTNNGTIKRGSSCQVF